jgi:hypothetical protein
VDGNPVKIPDGATCLNVLNIQSYAGGGDLWGKHEETPGEVN